MRSIASACRQALRLFEERERQLTPEDLVVIREPEVRGSRLFETVAEDDADAGLAADRPAPAPAPDRLTPDLGGMP